MRLAADQMDWVGDWEGWMAKSVGQSRIDYGTMDEATATATMPVLAWHRSELARTEHCKVGIRVAFASRWQRCDGQRGDESGCSRGGRGSDGRSEKKWAFSKGQQACGMVRVEIVDKLAEGQEGRSEVH